MHIMNIIIMYNIYIYIYIHIFHNHTFHSNSNSSPLTIDTLRLETIGFDLGHWGLNMGGVLTVHVEGRDYSGILSNQ